MSEGILSTPTPAPAAEPATLPSGDNGRVQPGEGFVKPSGDPVADPGLALGEHLPHKPGADTTADPAANKAPAEAAKPADAKPEGDAAKPGGTEPAAKDAKSGTEDAKATAPDGTTDPAVAGDYSQLKVPDGFKASDDDLKQFREYATTAKLSADAAQAVLNYEATRQKEALAARDQMVTQQDTEWIDAIRKDPEIGGDKLLPSLKSARDAMARFGSEPLFKFLKDTGLDNHPELVRAFARIGAATADDRTDAPTNRGGAQRPAWDDYSDLYPELQAR